MSTIIVLVVITMYFFGIPIITGLCRNAAKPMPSMPTLPTWDTYTQPNAEHLDNGWAKQYLESGGYALVLDTQQKEM